MGLVGARPLVRTDAGGKRIPGSSDRGAGDVKMDLTDAGRKLFGGPPGAFEARFNGGPIFLPAGSGPPAYVSLGTFRSEVWKDESQRGEMVGTPAIIAERLGEGRVILFSPHLEFTKGFEPLVRRGVVAARRSSADH